MCQGRQEKQAQTGTARKDRHGPPHGGLLGQSEHGDPDSVSSSITKATRTCLQGASLYAPLGDLMITRGGRPRGFKNPTPNHGPGPVAHVADDCGSWHRGQDPVPVVNVKSYQHVAASTHFCTGCLPAARGTGSAKPKISPLWPLCKKHTC